MNIGIPKERRPFEFRVGLPPAGVEILTQHGHQVYVEHEAGMGADLTIVGSKRATSASFTLQEEVFMRAPHTEDRTPIEGRIELAATQYDTGGFLDSAFCTEDKTEVLLEKKITSDRV